jgi:hypothetical protein
MPSKDSETRNSGGVCTREMIMKPFTTHSERLQNIRTLDPSPRNPASMCSNMNMCTSTWISSSYMCLSSSYMCLSSSYMCLSSSYMCLSGSVTHTCQRAPSRCLKYYCTSGTGSFPMFCAWHFHAHLHVEEWHTGTEDYTQLFM